MRLIKRNRFFYDKNIAIYSVANTINKCHLQSDLHLIYKQNFYHDKIDEINTIFYEYHIPLLNNLDHPALIEEWKRNLDTAAYKKHSNKI